MRLYFFLFLLTILNCQVFGKSSGLVSGGIYTVGAAAGNDFQTLEAAINAVNRGVSGPTTLLLVDPNYSISDLPLTITANITNPLTIKPAPGINMVTISGSSPSSIFKIENADYVTIDGSNTPGGNTRNLTIINSNTDNSIYTVIWIANTSLSDPANHNTIKNCILSGSAKDKTLACIFSGGSTIGIGSNAKAGCSYNTFDNNFISKAQNGIYIIGVSSFNPDNSLTVSNNSFGGIYNDDGFVLSGITIKNQSNAVILNNDIQNIIYNGSIATLSDASGNKIHAGLYLFNSKSCTVASNKIHNINISSTSIPKRCYALSLESPAFNSLSLPSDNFIYDNMIFDCRYSGSIAVSSWAYSGINANGGYGDQFYFNSVRLSGNFSTAVSSYAAFSNGNGVNPTTTNAVTLKNNVFEADIDATVEGNPASSFYAHYSKLNVVSSENNWSNNDLYVEVSDTKGKSYIGYLAGNKTLFSDWLAAVPENNSVNITPSFLSLTDLHLTNCSGLDNLGIPVSIPEIVADIDGDTRAGTNPDIGADEFTSDGVTWTGAVNTDWNTPENWCSFMVPSSLTNVSIPVVTNLPVLNSSATARNIHIDPGASINLNDQTLIVNGAFTGSGSLSGSANAGLIINTGGDAGTVYFTKTSPYNQLKILTINESSTLSLGGNSVNGDTLNIAAGNETDGYGTVTANGTINANGILTIKSNTNGDARVGISAGSIIGEVTVERFIPARRAWRLLSVPFISSTQTINKAWQEGVHNSDATLNYANNQNPNPGYGTHITSDNNTSLGYDYNTTVNPSLKTWDIGTQSWTVSTPPTLTTAITNYKAYMTFVRGSRAVHLEMADNSPVDATVLRSKGQLSEQGLADNSITKTLNGNTGDWVELGNPFASPINALDVLKNENSKNIDKTRFSVWDPKIYGSFGVGGYATYVNGIGWSPYDNNRITASHAQNDPPVIQSGQGFMVYTTNTNAQVEFLETDKYTYNTPGVYGFRMATPAASQYPAVFINLKKSDGISLVDGVAAGFDNSFSAYVDSHDVEKLPDNMMRPSEELNDSLRSGTQNSIMESIALYRENKSLSIEFKPVLTSDTLFLKLSLNQGAHSLEIFTANGFNATGNLSLVDKYLNISTPVTDSLLYNFVTTADTNSYENRFIIVLARNDAPNSYKRQSDSGDIYCSQDTSILNSIARRYYKQAKRDDIYFLNKNILATQKNIEYKNGLNSVKKNSSAKAISVV